MLDVERLQFLDLYSFELRLDYFEKILEFTSSSYSFYWLEAILNLMIYKDTIEFDEILDEMISLAYEDVVEKGYHLGPLIHQIQLYPYKSLNLIWLLTNKRNKKNL